MKIHIIEDDEVQANNMAKLLSDHKMMCEIDRTGDDGLCSIQTMSYDLVLLDINLPNIDGLDLLKRLRFTGINVPVIAISGVESSETRLECLEYADDFISKPYSNNDLLARIKAVRRRYDSASWSIIQIGNLSLNTRQGLIFIDDKLVQFTKTEYALIEALVIKKNSVITKNVLLDAIYTKSLFEPNSKIIDVYIFKVRKKLEENNATVTIKTAWGRGCMLVEVE